MPQTDSHSTDNRDPIRLVCLLILLALALHAVSLGWGFNYDDYIHQYVMRYAMGWPGAAPWRLYDFSFWTHAAETQHHGNLAPWWTSPDFKVSFFRPVSSLVLWADYHLYGNWAPGYHITSLVLFAVLLFLVFRLYTELGAPRRAALWALAFFALKDINVLPVCWIANRNELLSNLFIVAMMINVIRHVRFGGLHRLAAGVVFFLCACLSKESGLIGLPLVGLYLLILGAPAPESFPRRCIRVMRSPVMWLFFFVAVAYFVAYVKCGHGSLSSNYATPWHRTGVYIGRVASLFPLASGSLFFGVSTDLIFTRPELYAPVLAISTALFLVLAWIYWRWLRDDPIAWFAAGWGAAALFPMAGVTLSDRLLMGASVGTALVLGLLMDRMGGMRDVLASVRSRWPALVFVTTGLVLSLPIAVVRQRMFHGMAEADRTAILASDFRRAGEPPRTAIVLNSPSTLLAITLSPTWAVGRDDPATAIYALQVARRGTDFLRENETTLIMTFEDPALLTHRYERVFHTRDDPPPPGAVFTNPAFKATVLTTEGRAIRSVRLEFPAALEKSGCIFLAWGDGAYKRVAPPAIGKHLHLAAPAPTVRWAP